MMDEENIIFVESEYNELTPGQILADKITKIAGSWAFITSFLFFLILWVCINCKAMFGEIFDPYPFILLNLFLSCLAAIQAPIILMSQNRQSEKDRTRLEHDIMLDEKADKKLDMTLRRIDIVESKIIDIQKRLDNVFKD